MHKLFSEHYQTATSPSPVEAPPSLELSLTGLNDEQLASNLMSEYHAIVDVEKSRAAAYYRLGIHLMEYRKRHGCERYHEFVKAHNIDKTRASRAKTIATNFSYDEVLQYSSLRKVLDALPRAQPRRPRKVARPSPGGTPKNPGRPTEALLDRPGGDSTPAPRAAKKSKAKKTATRTAPPNGKDNQQSEFHHESVECLSALAKAVGWDQVLSVLRLAADFLEACGNSRYQALTTAEEIIDSRDSVFINPEINEGDQTHE